MTYLKTAVTVLSAFALATPGIANAAPPAAAKLSLTSAASPVKARAGAPVGGTNRMISKSWLLPLLIALGLVGGVIAATSGKSVSR